VERKATNRAAKPVALRVAGMAHPRADVFGDLCRAVGEKLTGDFDNGQATLTMAKLNVAVVAFRSAKAA
jgi:hypothetical protein